MSREVGVTEGLFVAPEGAACFAALGPLLDAGKIARDERIVIFNTGSGIKYLDCYEVVADEGRWLDGLTDRD